MLNKAKTLSGYKLADLDGDGSVEVVLRGQSGFGDSEGNRIALGNIRERLQLHFDVEAKMDSGVVGKSYEIHMQMPYRRRTT